MWDRKHTYLFIVLAGIFVTNAILAELIGGKLIPVLGTVMSLGILPWPIVFLTTDLVNEYFGKKSVHFLSWLTVALILYCFLVLQIGIDLPTATISSISHAEFTSVFGQGQWIIIGSCIAFLVSQLLDAYLFSSIKAKTGNKWLWMRSTGSTVVSQLIDSFIVLGIAFYLPGIIDFNTFILSGLTGYSIKLLIAIGLTPLIYLGHAAIDRYLGK